MIGNSLPRSRKNAAWVPLMFVRMVLATLETDRPSSAAFGRSTRIASSGRPSSRPICGLAIAGRVLQDLEHVLRQPLAHRRVCSPRISTASRLSWLPPPRRRLSCWLPPDARVVIVTPGSADEHAAQIGRDLVVRARRARRAGSSLTLTLRARRADRP